MNRLTNKGFTLIELLVVVAIIVVLIAILLPSLGQARRQAQAVGCLANMSALGKAALAYAQTNSDIMMPAGLQYSSARSDSGFIALLINGDLVATPLQAESNFVFGTSSTYPRLSYRSPFICPTTPNMDQTDGINQDGYITYVAFFFNNQLKWRSEAYLNNTNALIIQSSYGINGSNAANFLPCQTLYSSSVSYNPSVNQSARKINSVPAPGSMVFLYDGLGTNPWQPRADGQGNTTEIVRIIGRHGAQTAGASASSSGSTNIAFFDGHAETIARNKLPSLRTELTGDASSLATKRSMHPLPYWRLDEAQ